MKAGSSGDRVCVMLLFLTPRSFFFVSRECVRMDGGDPLMERGPLVEAEAEPFGGVARHGR